MGQNSKYAPQKSQPKLPTSMVKTLSAHLKGQNLNAIISKVTSQNAHLKVKNLSAHLNRQNPKFPPETSKS